MASYMMLKMCFLDVSGPSEVRKKRQKPKNPTSRNEAYGI
jgi:hypothetical protein